MSVNYRVFLTIMAVIGLLLTSGSFSAAAAPNAAANKGVFSSGSFSKKDILPLNGQWEFYWHELYTPADFKRHHVQQRPQFFAVPQTWTNDQVNGRKLPLAGYATYRLLLIFPRSEIGTVKALYMPVVSSAYTLWIDGVKKSSNGKVGTVRQEMKPGNVPKVIPFQVKSSQVELIIQASNFHQRKAGITDSIFIGEPEPILNFREKSLIYRTIIVVSLLTIGFYHFALFAFRKKKEPSLIFFGVTCVCVAIRAILLEDALASYILPFLNWEMARKLEYMGATLGILFFSLFTYTQFSKDMNRMARNLIIFVMALYSLFIAVTPAVIFTRAMVLLQVLIDLSYIYLLYVYLIAFLRKREGALLNAAAIFMMFLAAVNDTLFYNNLIHTTELSSFGLIFFLFSQAIMISKRYSLSFARTEKLSHELVNLNASLEQQVNQRTAELQQANQQLHIMNQQLNEAHQSRSHWIRNLSHEIATPLTSIRAYTRGILDGVVPSEQQNIQLIYEQSLYLSRMLDDLHDMTDIENQQIKFDLEKVNIQEYVHKIFEKYQLDIEKKGIGFRLKDRLAGKMEACFVLMDRMRIEQVIVNLLTNAQRFVPQSGWIVMELDRLDKDHVIVQVKDNGSGIPEAELELVFKRFYRGENQGKAHNGSGLGLAISKEIIDYHNGELFVVSKVGEGSCFSFTLLLVSQSSGRTL